MNIFRKRIALVSFVLLASVTLSGCVFKGSTPSAYKVNLEIWGVFDDSDAYAEVFNEYREKNPYVQTFTYRKLPVETYKEDLLDALAAGKGPDIFMIRNSWVPSFQDKIVPAPEETLGEKRFRDAFVDVAAFDFIGEKDKKVYGVPVSVDSLALYYNKDIFNAAGIATPPATWEEAATIAPSLNRIDGFGNITQSAIALGTAKNINRSTDILSAMIFQNGSTFSSGSQLSLSETSTVDAFRYYAQYAAIDSPAYSWNPRLHYSLDAFYEGTLGMMVNYSWQYPTLKQKNAKLNIGIAPLPQFTGKQPSNYANYWGYAVAKNKDIADIPGDTSKLTKEQKKALHEHESWQFLRFLALPHPENVMTFQNGLSGNTKDFTLAFDPAEKYLEKTKKPAARRDLIEKQKSDPILGAFATGNLLAKNWTQQNPEGVETVLAEMIESVNSGQQVALEALRIAENRLKLMR